MRTLTLFLLALPLFVAAQTEPDTARTPGGEHSLEIGFAPGKGFGARVESTDSARRAEENGRDTIRIELKRKIVTILTEPRTDITQEDSINDRLKDLRRQRRNLFTHWSGLDLGLNNYLTADGGFDLDSADGFMELEIGRSRFVSLNFMEQKIEFGSHHVGLLTGLGVEWRNYLLARNVALGYNSDSTYAVEVTEPAYKKNKLRLTGLRMPLLLEFNTKRAPMPTPEEIRTGRCTDFSRKGNFHIAMGVIGTWWFDTMYKTKYRMDGETKKDRNGGSHNLEPLSAMATVRIGYGSLNLFAEYGLTPLFKNGRGPELTPVNIGLTLIGFN